jgi:predicted ester cyclase
MSAADNKAIIRRLYDEVFQAWQLSVINDLVAPKFVGHEMPAGTPPGLEGFRQCYAGLRSAFPDLRYTVDDLIAEGDMVVVRWTWSCTHIGVFRNIAPTGRQAVVTGMAIYRLVGGKIVERWVELGMHRLLHQLSVPVGPGADWLSDRLTSQGRQPSTYTDRLRRQRGKSTTGTRERDCMANGDRLIWVITKDTGSVQTEKTGDRHPEQRPTPPNNRLQVTGNSVRSSLAPAISRT